MKNLSLGQVLTVCVAGLACLPMTLVADQAVSHVRVVRLSYVSGTVGVKRQGATEWSKAREYPHPGGLRDIDLG
jgi:hypothetical protein